MPRKAVPGPGIGNPNLLPMKRVAAPKRTNPVPQSDKQSRPSAKDQTHYCRVCALTITETEQESAHVVTVKHQIRYRHHYIHPLEGRCDRSCSARQQSEEETAGRMIYGNVLKPKRTKQALAESQKRIDLYEKLFPPEEN